MQYLNYEEQIVIRYGIKLEGWTYDTLKNPSELSTSLPPLQALSNAIDNGTCKFIKMSAAEKKKYEDEFHTKVQSGEVNVRKRKIRKDAGKKKAKRRRTEAKEAAASGEGSDESEEEEPVTGFKSTEFITDDD
jgi:hypothetical protein